MSEKALTARDFQPVKDPGEALALLKEAAQSLASALAWTRNQESTLNTYFLVCSEVDKLLYAWIPKDVDSKEFSASIARTGEMACYFSVSLSKASIFFKADFAGFDDGGFKFRFPEAVFKVQRRKDMRYTVPETNPITVIFDDPMIDGEKITKRMIDISAGGLAFEIGELEGALYPVGQVLKNCRFSVLGRAYQCDGEIRHVRGSKVGLLFNGLPPADAAVITKFVFDETRKQFTQMV